MIESVSSRNRLGFLILGLTNNFSYVIMLSAAMDLLKNEKSQPAQPNTSTTTSTTISPIPNNETIPFCNEHSTSTILLADTIPSLTIKFIYPFLLVGLATGYKAFGCAFLSMASFLITGFSDKVLPLVFTGVICASLSSGLGEATYLSNTPLYGDSSMGGWAIGTGAAGLVGSGVYALLAQFIGTNLIMRLMIIIPIIMMLSYWCIIEPISENERQAEYVEPVTQQQTNSEGPSRAGFDEKTSSDESMAIKDGTTLFKNSSERRNIKNYGSQPTAETAQSDHNSQDIDGPEFDLRAKLRFLPSIAKYTLPLMLVYFAEYFINQGLFELIYFKDMKLLTKDEQYRWYQVFYQIGVMISRSSVEIFQIEDIWLMSILQFINIFLFLGHVTEVYNIPSFYIVILLITYEGLLGGFTYVNAFFRIKKEVDSKKVEFAISTATLADTLGIVLAGLSALPVHDALCRNKTLTPRTKSKDKQTKKRRYEQITR